MKTYTVAYTMFPGDEERHISVMAKNKADAYDRAAYSAIPANEGAHPYAAWVHSVTYGNGRKQTFETFEGKRF